MKYEVKNMSYRRMVGSTEFHAIGIHLKLCNDEEELSSKIKIKENIDGRICREVIETSGIAFEHGN